MRQYAVMFRERDGLGLAEETNDILDLGDYLKILSVLFLSKQIYILVSIPLVRIYL